MNDTHGQWNEQLYPKQVVIQLTENSSNIYFYLMGRCYSGDNEIIQLHSCTTILFSPPPHRNLPHPICYQPV